MGAQWGSEERDDFESPMVMWFLRDTVSSLLGSCVCSWKEFPQGGGAFLLGSIDSGTNINRDPKTTNFYPLHPIFGILIELLFDVNTI